MNKLKLIFFILLSNSVYSNEPVLVSQQKWHGEYIPEKTPHSVASLGNDIRTSTVATVGDAIVNELVYGWAIFRIHVKPSWTPYECTITTQVCMMGNYECENISRSYLFQSDGAVLDDDQSYRAGYTYRYVGQFQTSSHVYMDRCGGDRYNSDSTGIITVKQKNKA